MKYNMDHFCFQRTADLVNELVVVFNMLGFFICSTLNLTSKKIRASFKSMVAKLV